MNGNLIKRGVQFSESTLTQEFSCPQGVKITVLRSPKGNLHENFIIGQLKSASYFLE